MFLKQQFWRCDTEDWSNDAENSDLKSHELILKYIQIENKL